MDVIKVTALYKILLKCASVSLSIIPLNSRHFMCSLREAFIQRNAFMSTSLLGGPFIQNQYGRFLKKINNACCKIFSALIIKFIAIIACVLLLCFSMANILESTFDY